MESALAPKVVFIIQDGAQVPILAFYLHSYAIDKSRCSDRRVLMKINKNLFCPRDKKVASVSHYTIWGQGLRQSVVKNGFSVTSSPGSQPAIIKCHGQYFIVF